MKNQILELDPTAYADGIAVWSAMAPVFDATGACPEAGLRVDARERPRQAKIIDETFGQVEVDGETQWPLKQNPLLFVVVPSVAKCGTLRVSTRRRIIEA